jgi:hypothetical protein
MTTLALQPGSEEQVFWTTTVFSFRDFAVDDRYVKVSGRVNFNYSLIHLAGSARTLRANSTCYNSKHVWRRFRFDMKPVRTLLSILVILFTIISTLYLVAMDAVSGIGRFYFPAAHQQDFAGKYAWAVIILYFINCAFLSYGIYRNRPIHLIIALCNFSAIVFALIGINLASHT